MRGRLVRFSPGDDFLLKGWNQFDNITGVVLDEVEDEGEPYLKVFFSPLNKTMVVPLGWCEIV